MKKKIAVALSGGIDSLIAAYMLKQQGIDIIGIHFLTGYEKPSSGQTDAKAAASENLSDISRQLDTPVKILDCSDDFKKKVIDYFSESYLKGLTPNPCLKCNPLIKFGPVLDFARELGASHLATGHYVRLIKDRKRGFQLLRAKDRLKDQSYFLSFLTQRQLNRACFPLGQMKKTEVRLLAKEKGLKPVVSQESQDICFIRPKETYGSFLRNQPGYEFRPGPIETVDGQTIGEHHGLHLFTVGQRRGINCPATEPYYVLRIDTTNNRLVVGFKKDLLSLECSVTDINWITAKPSDPVRCHVQLRYRHKAVASELIPLDQNRAVVRFDKPQPSVTPGQGAVFYQNDLVLGGGWIQAPDAG